MKWSHCYLYTRAQVKMLSPPTPGIYRLLIKNRIFYVGQCLNIRRRLFEHLGSREGNRKLKRYLQKYRCFFRFAELESAEDLLTAEREQIRKYNPPCNMDIRTIEENMRAPKYLKKQKKNKCRRCGFEIAEGAVLCGECGCEDDCRPN